MSVRIRPALPADIDDCGRIIHEAFTGIAAQHGFPSDFPTVEDGTRLARQRIPNPLFYCLVAELDGRIAGSSFISERDPIRGIGTVSVAPATQDHGVGRLMMAATVERGKDAPGMRLTQDAFNTASMPLYASFGFDVQEPLVQMEGSFKSAPVAGVELRAMTADDIPTCEDLCLRVHGFPRTRETLDALLTLAPFVALRAGRLVAYTTALAKRGHSVAASDDDLRALLLGINAAVGGRFAFLLPNRQGSLFRWGLADGLRVIKPLTLMTRGAYQDPAGAFLVSTQY